MLDIVYQERANGRFEYWMYSEGWRVYVSEQWAKREFARRNIELRDVQTNIKFTDWQ